MRAQQECRYLEIIQKNCHRENAGQFFSHILISKTREERHEPRKWAWAYSSREHKTLGDMSWNNVFVFALTLIQSVSNLRCPLALSSTISSAFTEKVQGLNQVPPNSHLTLLQQQYNSPRLVTIFFSAWLTFDKEFYLRGIQIRIRKGCYTHFVSTVSQDVLHYSHGNHVPGHHVLSPEMKELGSGWRDRNWLT